MGVSIKISGFHFLKAAYFFGRSEKIRTSGLLVPNQVTVYKYIFINCIKNFINSAFKALFGIGTNS